MTTENIKNRNRPSSVEPATDSKLSSPLTFNPDPKLISHRFDRLRVRLWFDRFDWLTALRLSTGEDRGEAHSKSGPEVLEGKESFLILHQTATNSCFKHESATRL